MPRGAREGALLYICRCVGSGITYPSPVDRFPPRLVPRGWDLYVFRASSKVMQGFDYLGGPASSPGRSKGRTLSPWYAGLGRGFVPLLEGVARACALDVASSYEVVRHDRRGPYLVRFSDRLTVALAEEDSREFTATVREHPAFAAYSKGRTGAWERKLPYELDAVLIGAARLAHKHGDQVYAWIGPGAAPVASPRLRTWAEQFLRTPSDGK